MTKKELKKRIEQYIKEAQSDMNLQNWSIIIYYDDDLKSVGQCERDREYLRAWITFNLDKILEDIEIGKTENIIIQCCYHEVVHILTYELEFLAKSRYVAAEEIYTERERLAESITRIILKLKKK